MSVRIIPIKCPECGAEQGIEEGRTQAFCSYCGTKFMINNENEQIFRTIDEARIKENETDRLIRLKELELEEKRREEEARSKKIKMIISLTLGTIGILMLAVGFMMGSASGDGDSPYYAMACVGFFPLMGSAFPWMKHSK